MSLRAWVQGRISWLQGYAFGLFVQVGNRIAQAIAAVRRFFLDRVNWAIGFLRGLFGWIQHYRALITQWLVGARAVIDWLWHHAWGQLRAFLANPIAWVLGWLLSPITNLVNWWQRWGAGLMAFTVEDLPRLRNLLSRGFAFLSAFVDHPVDVILELLAPVVIEWAAGVLADNW